MKTNTVESVRIELLTLDDMINQARLHQMFTADDIYTKCFTVLKSLEDEPCSIRLLSLGIPSIQIKLVKILYYMITYGYDKMVQALQTSGELLDLIPDSTSQIDLTVDVVIHHLVFVYADQDPDDSDLIHIISEDCEVLLDIYKTPRSYLKYIINQVIQILRSRQS